MGLLDSPQVYSSYAGRTVYTERAALSLLYTVYSMILTLTGRCYREADLDGDGKVEQSL